MFIKNFLKRKNKKPRPAVTNDEVYAGVINTLEKGDIRILVDLAIKMGLNVPKELQEEMRRRAQIRTYEALFDPEFVKSELNNH